MTNFFSKTNHHTFYKHLHRHTQCILRFRIQKTSVNLGRDVAVGVYRRRNCSSNSNSAKLISLVVTSLRVDRVAASGLGIARRKVDQSLLSGKIFLNGEKVAKKSRQLVEGDVINMIAEIQPNKESIKYGQVQVIKIGDLTKKGNYNIDLVRQKSLSIPAEDFWDSVKPTPKTT